MKFTEEISYAFFTFLLFFKEVLMDIYFCGQTLAMKLYAIVF